MEKIPPPSICSLFPPHLLLYAIQSGAVGIPINPKRKIFSIERERLGSAVRGQPACSPENGAIKPFYYPFQVGTCRVGAHSAPAAVMHVCHSSLSASFGFNH